MTEPADLATPARTAKANEVVMWMPWRGSSYDSQRLLILGESCYLLKDQQGALHMPSPDHPRRYVGHAIADKEYRYRFYTMIARALSGKAELTDEDWRSAWDKVAHTNYIPTAVLGRGRDRPSEQQWAEAAFSWPDLLEELRPRAVIVLGLTMWERMPATVKRIDRLNHDYALADHTPVKCRAVRHPSAGLGWKNLQQAIEDVLAR